MQWPRIIIVSAVLAGGALVWSLAPMLNELGAPAPPIAEAACGPYINQAQLQAEASPACRKTFIVDPGVGDLLTRNEFLDPNVFAYYIARGYHQNFLWYAPSVSMHVPYQGEFQPGVIPWASCSNSPFNALSGPLSLCPPAGLGFPHINSTAGTSTFQNGAGVNLDVIQWPLGPATDQTTFIAKVCGNYSIPKSGVPIPKISGSKYEDLNANGTRNGGEPGLGGWTVQLRNGGGTVVATTTTDSSGNYEFNLLDLGPDTYTVTEVLQPGWVQRQAPGPISVGVGVGDQVFGTNDFGNFRPANPSGVKYDDLNGNGARDGGESGLGGWTITLAGTDGYGAAVNRSAVTAPGTGAYSFANVVPGNYTLTETLQVTEDWVKTQPSSPNYSFPLSSNEARSDFLFGNLVRAEVRGAKFEDMNEDGDRDPEDAGLGGWQIRLQGADGMSNPVNRTTVTAGDGTYEFVEIMPGTYTVCETNPDLSVWFQTRPPANACYPFILQSHSVQNGVDFGNYERSTIQGVKYRDHNKDGEQDVGEPPLGGWEITLRDCNGNIVPQSVSSVTQPGETADPNPQVTNGSGQYQFRGLHNQCYRIDETPQPPEWVQTQPCRHPATACGYEIPSAPSGSVFTRDFGNFEQPIIAKVPEGNEHNADISVPKANLWLCDDTDGPGPVCSGPGEGNLIVIERVTNVHTGDENGDQIEDGLGAYEFTVEYDNFVIQSVNPCDIVFGPTGLGVTRGPVDELDSSDNPYCSPDPGGANNGTCAMSLILENLVHFGCVTNGQLPGPTGDFDIAALNLIPHPDLRNDIFPGNNNGVLTVLKDNGCELVDTFGHPIIGSVDGGLTPLCRDLAVTVRILEGDMDLDCDVDLTDAQMLAARYGAFFGGLLYSKWYDLEPELHDLDIDIKDVQKVFGREGSTCQLPIPEQPPLDPPTPFQD